MEPEESELVDRLLSNTLSMTGASRVRKIRELDQLLFDNPEFVDSRFRPEDYGKDQYKVAIFGQPKLGKKWMFRLQGHHLSVNVTLSGNNIISSTPQFFGEYPRISHLRGQEAAARRLAIHLHSRGALGADLGAPLPRRILLLPGENNVAVLPSGIRYSALEPQEREKFNLIVAYFIETLSPSEQTRMAARFTEAKLRTPDELHFRWMGHFSPGSPVHFLIQLRPGVGITLEHQNLDGQHVHSVLRDFDNDFGGR